MSPGRWQHNLAGDGWDHRLDEDQQSDPDLTELVDVTEHQANQSVLAIGRHG